MTFKKIIIYPLITVFLATQVQASPWARADEGSDVAVNDQSLGGLSFGGRSVNAKNIIPVKKPGKEQDPKAKGEAPSPASPEAWRMPSPLTPPGIAQENKNGKEERSKSSAPKGIGFIIAAEAREQKKPLIPIPSLIRKAFEERQAKQEENELQEISDIVLDLASELPEIKSFAENEEMSIEPASLDSMIEEEKADTRDKEEISSDAFTEKTLAEAEDLMKETVFSDEITADDRESEIVPEMKNEFSPAGIEEEPEMTTDEKAAAEAGSLEDEMRMGTRADETIPENRPEVNQELPGEEVTFEIALSPEEDGIDEGEQLMMMTAFMSGVDMNTSNLNPPNLGENGHWIWVDQEVPDPAALAEIEALEAQIADLENQKTGIQNQIDALDQQIQSLNDQIAAVEQQLERLHQALDRVNGRIMDLQDQIDQIQNQIDAKTAQYRAKEAQWNALYAQNVAMDQQARMLRLELISIPRPTAQRRREISRTLRELTAQFHQNIREMNQLRREGLRLAREVRTLERQKRAKQRQLADEIRTRDRILDNIDRAEERKERLEERKAEKERQKQALIDQMADLDAQIQALRDLIEELRGRTIIIKVRKWVPDPVSNPQPPLEDPVVLDPSVSDPLPNPLVEDPILENSRLLTADEKIEVIDQSVS